MRKLSTAELKLINGGYHIIAECSIKCSDGKFHSYNCGNNGCATNAGGLIDCYNSNGTVVSSNNNPCPVNMA